MTLFEKVLEGTLMVFAIAMLLVMIHAHSEYVTYKKQRLDVVLKKYEEKQEAVAVDAACRVLVQANLVKRCQLTKEGTGAERAGHQYGRDR
jgi:hypothetical protein